MCQYGNAVRIANQLSARARTTRPNDDIGMRMPAAKSLATRLLLLPTVELFCFGRVYAREQIAPKSQIKAKPSKHAHAHRNATHTVDMRSNVARCNRA